MSPLLKNSSVREYIKCCDYYPTGIEYESTTASGLGFEGCYEGLRNVSDVDVVRTIPFQESFIRRGCEVLVHNLRRQIEVVDRFALGDDRSDIIRRDKGVVRIRRG